MSVYYNEIDPFAAEWLRRLMIDGLIAWGDVDERSIEDVKPDDLRPYRQCHFFAGIGVWSYALRRAGWDDDRPIWTGSCPCQPFSAAGKGGGFADERHLWPAFHHLIRECDPAIVIGEQVASKDGLAWLDLVRADMEGEGRAFAAADLCTAGFGAPHIRQRAYWLAYAMRSGAGHDTREGVGAEAALDGSKRGLQGQRLRVGVEGASGGLAYDTFSGRGEERQDRSGGSSGNGAKGLAAGLVPRGDASGLADTGSGGSTARLSESVEREEGFSRVHDDGDGQRLGGEPATGSTNGFWRNADWLGCRDGKWRPVEPGTFPLAHGASARVGRLRGYGNAIAAPVAQGFIEAVMETL